MLGTTHFNTFDVFTFVLTGTHSAVTATDPNMHWMRGPCPGRALPGEAHTGENCSKPEPQLTPVQVIITTVFVLPQLGRIHAIGLAAHVATVPDGRTPPLDSKSSD